MDKIAVLDFGGQYANLIANKIRRMGVFTEIHDGDCSVDELRDYKGIVLSGGPASVSGPDALVCDARLFELGVPVLGICYGHQLMAHTLGGVVEKGHVMEYGQAEVNISDRTDLFEGLKESETVWMSHFDQVSKVPEGFEIVASTEDCPIAATKDTKRNFYSIQFHCEVTHTPCGRQILENFVQITGAKREWSIDGYIEDITAQIQKQAEGKRVFLMISGGVDSTVAFLLLAKALGHENVYGLFVDIGFMRLNEREEVEESLKGIGVENLHVYDAGAEYFEALKGVYEPEEKRKIIGNLFLDVQAKVSDELGLNPDEWLLGQGTIYPDTIETGGTKHAHTIKTHHNQVPRVKEMMEQGKVIEPINQLYKDEVRLVGARLGLSEKMTWRHPFPGPGLAVRTLCAKAADVVEVSDEMRAVAEKFGMKITILPIKSVGVQGDERTYAHPAVVYGKRIPWKELNSLATQLTNQFPEVNRVVYGLSPSSFDSLTVQDSYLTPERILTIQKADKVVMDFLTESGIHRDIWQFPTVLVPVQVGGSGESIVLRPVCSEEAMTANFYEMSDEHLDDLVRRLSAVEGVGGIFYDITNKPPGTIEWE
ncbi:glutamine-hydrolyzing GMP synthase [Candidatus Gracilibacteria bacterium]|nr:glutamine-hydrolyzing GMP synthase [Candidatus Gracilibacteria bacterium]